jgi:hypothetical protein
MVKLPNKVLATTFTNAQGSTIPEEFAVEARKDPGVINEMAETVQELKN